MLLVIRTRSGALVSQARCVAEATRASRASVNRHRKGSVPASSSWSTASIGVVYGEERPSGADGRSSCYFYTGRRKGKVKRVIDSKLVRNSIPTRFLFFDVNRLASRWASPCNPVGQPAFPQRVYAAA